jgi:hypothetical protein
MVRNRSLFASCILSFAFATAHAQTPSPPKAPTTVAEEAAREWFIRLNELDDWHISFEGKEENDAVVDRLTQFPWGGTGASTQFEAIFTNREDRRQFVIPGAVFFIFDETGKIQNLRLYLLRDETAEIA